VEALLALKLSTALGTCAISANRTEETRGKIALGAPSICNHSDVWTAFSRDQRPTAARAPWLAADLSKGANCCLALRAMVPYKNIRIH